MTTHPTHPTHPTLLAIAEVIWAARQPVQGAGPAPETTAELVASCWATMARLDAAQARADAALARLAT